VKTFTHINATSIADAGAKMTQYGTSARLIAGGTDLIPFLKDRALPDAQLPKYLINLKTITPALDTIKVDGTTLKIGALARLHDIAFSADVLSKWSSLAAAARAVSMWPVRQMGTIGGNICCNKRCWYYRSTWNKFQCVLNGGTGCPAALGQYRYESVFGATNGCYAVNPNDIPPVLLALSAKIITNKNAAGYDADKFFDGFKVTVLGAGEFITEVDIPAPAAGSKQAFAKATERRAVDFASACVAILVTPATGTITAARVVLGAVGTVPILSAEAATALIGKSLDATSAAAAATAAVSKANAIGPLNKYKIPMTSGLVKRALLS
jgi:xanthine dehydrogenase YagS FAD-binding subunit